MRERPQRGRKPTLGQDRGVDATRELLEVLPEDLRSIAGWRLVDGLTIEGIARRCRVSVRTVERRLELIRDLWERADLGIRPDAVDATVRPHAAVLLKVSPR